VTIDGLQVGEIGFRGSAAAVGDRNDARRTTHRESDGVTLEDVVREGTLLAVALAFTALAPAFVLAQAPQGATPSGLVDNPCPPPLQMPPELAEILKSPNRDALMAAPPPAVVAYNQEQARRTRDDWGNLCRYRADNAARVAADAPAPTAVFMGDSITEGWARLGADFFSANGYVGRGISGQVTGQNLLRFQQDVINLHPKVVHIMIGTNDVAGNAGPTTYENIQNNLMAMVQMARANKIAVVLATIPPSTDFPWRRGMEPALKFVKLNEWIRDYASAKTWCSSTTTRRWRMRRTGSGRSGAETACTPTSRATRS